MRAILAPLVSIIATLAACAPTYEEYRAAATECTTSELEGFGDVETILIIRGPDRGALVGIATDPAATATWTLAEASTTIVSDSQVTVRGSFRPNGERDFEIDTARVGDGLNGTLAFVDDTDAPVTCASYVATPE